ncbi:protein draper-like isoform X2 [Octopus sinensis]|nr:protein draper-like isoform X2 [Octopus sinensis]
MSSGNLITFCTGILLMLSIEQIFTIQCNDTQGDCVADDKRGEDSCKSTCFRNLDYGTDLFGKDQKFQCHCKNITDCGFRILSECERGCSLGYKLPYCQRRKYHEFIQNERNNYSHLFSSHNQIAVKPQIRIQFRNTYRFNTVAIYSNYSDSTMRVTYPGGMECNLKPNTNKTMCTGDATADKLYIDGKAGVNHIKLIGCPPELYGKNCTNECHCSRGESCHQISGICKNGCEDGWHGKKCDKQTYVNIAQGKQTNQTSIYRKLGENICYNGKCSEFDIMTSDKAVDGNFDHAVPHKSCAQTKSETDPYWQVTLDKPYMISQLRIYNQMNESQSLEGFKVYLESTLCFEGRKDKYMKEVINIKCQKPVNSSNVKISLEGKKRRLTLCEVEVLQCVPGFYGDMCKEHCEFCEGSKCDQVTGYCEEGCVIEYYWDNNSKKCKEKCKYILVYILVPLTLFAVLNVGISAAISCW